MTISRQTVSLSTDTGGNDSAHCHQCDGELVQVALINGVGAKALDTGSTLTLTFDTGGANKTIFSSQLNDTLWRGVFDTGGDPTFFNGEKLKVAVQGQHGTGDTGTDTGRELVIRTYFREVH